MTWKYLATVNFRAVLEQTIRHVERTHGADVCSLEGSRAAESVKSPPRWHAPTMRMQSGVWMRQTS